jgi:hypothetical protein
LSEFSGPLLKHPERFFRTLGVFIIEGAFAGIPERFATFGNIYGWRLEEIPSFKWSQVDRVLGIIGLKLAKPRTMRAGLCTLMMKSGKYLPHSGKNGRLPRS